MMKLCLILLCALAIGCANIKPSHVETAVKAGMTILELIAAAGCPQSILYPRGMDRVPESVLVYPNFTVRIKDGYVEFVTFNN